MTVQSISCSSNKYLIPGRAERLPELYLRWQEFLSGGYDTIGENWGAGTHAHGWSCTPSRDMLVYTLGVTPAEPGLTRAHIAPHLGRLEGVKGSLPTPSGAITLEVASDMLTIDSPIPCEVDLVGQPLQKLAARRHTFVNQLQK